MDELRKEVVRLGYENVALVIRDEKDFRRWPVVKKAFRYLFNAIFGRTGNVNYVGCVFSAGNAYTIEKHHEIREEQRGGKSTERG
ncbi:hypothetical protein [Xenorhabdus sp. SGI240]|uniref:hypothetical protein n=1 Tax=Xenorhabdus sp. SGI240 TaxID=3158262 RepID=UPI0032B7762D